MPVSFVNFAAASSFPAYEAATEYPASFNAIDMAAPIPREPPVTRATLAIGVSLLVDGLVTLLQFMWIFRNIISRQNSTFPDEMKNKGPAAPYLDLCYGRSRHMATPIPPPIQRVASPFFASRRFISKRSVFKMRAPEAPMG